MRIEDSGTVTDDCVDITRVLGHIQKIIAHQLAASGPFVSFNRDNDTKRARALFFYKLSRLKVIVSFRVIGCVRS